MSTGAMAGLPAANDSMPLDTGHLLAPHPPILIIGDSSFIAANGVTAGTGTAADPYLINGWAILRNSTPGIRVVNTTSHFVIVSVNISGTNLDADGIRLENVENATVRDSEVWTNRAGIFARSSRDLRIENLTSGRTYYSGVGTDGGARILVGNSTFRESGEAGIWATFTDGLTVKNSTFITSGERGLMLEGARHFSVTDSRVERGRAGLELLNTDTGTIADNVFVDMPGDAVFLRTGDNNTISGNRIENATIGLLLGNSRWNRIRNNTIDRCLTAGMDLQQVTDSEIVGNLITNTTVIGLQLVASPNNTLRNNAISNAGYGFDLQSSNGEPSSYMQFIDQTNTIDGRPLVYARNAMNPTIPANAAYVALVNVTGATLGSLDLRRQGQGALIVLSSKIDVSNTSFVDNLEGVRVIRSDNLTLRNVTILDTGLTGLSVEASQNVTLADSTIAGSGSRGAYVKDAWGFTARDSTFRNNSQASIQISYGHRFAAIGNRFDNFEEVALEFDSSRDSLIERNHVTGGITAFQIDSADNTTVLNNLVEDVLGDGIYPRTSNRNIIIGNVVRRIPHPLDISLSNFNTVLNNTLEDVDVGIYFTYVSASRVENNTVRNVTFQGLLLEGSPLLYMRNNRVENARYGADIRSDPTLIQSYWLDADTSNMINGRPLRYITNATSPTIPEDTGFLGLVNVTGEVKGVPISNVSEGVLIAHSRDLVFRDATFRDTEFGPFVHASSNVTLENITSVRGLQGGAWVQESEKVTLSRIDLDGSVYGGAVFVQTRDSVLRDSIVHRTSRNGTAVRMDTTSKGNLVTNNRIADNLGEGVVLGPQTRGNHVYLNDFVNNSLHADDSSGLNWWNSTTRGNYWSGFDGTDKNCDGAAEKFYIVGTAGARDFRPLVKPFADVEVPCAPVQLGTTSTGADVLLKWRPPGYDGDGPVTGYLILRGADPGNLSEIAAAGPVLSYTDRALEPNRTFFYAVRAQNSAGTGPASGIASARTTYIPPPRPDLAVEVVLVEPLQPEAGESVRLRARTRNIGLAQALSGEVELLLAGAGGTAAVIATSALPAAGLAPGSSFDVVAERALPAGTYVLEARVSQPAPGEANQANDDAKTTFVVGSTGPTVPAGLAPRRQAWTDGPSGLATGALIVALMLALVAWLGASPRRAGRRANRGSTGKVPREKRGSQGKGRAGDKPGDSRVPPPAKAAVREAHQVKSVQKYVGREKKRKSGR